MTFAIAADLAHEAWSTAVSQQETAERAGRDFVRLTATSTGYEVRAAIDLGLRTLFSPLNTMAATSSDRSVPAELLLRSAARVRACHCAPSFTPRYYFRIQLPDSTVQTFGDSAPVPNERQRIRDTVLAHARAVRRPDWDDALIYDEASGDGRVIAYTVRQHDGDAVDIYGFVSDVGAFGDAVFTGRGRNAQRREVESATRGARYDSLMRTLILSTKGDAVYDANPRPAELRVTMLPRAGHESYAPGVAPVAAAMLFADTVGLGPRYGDLRLDVALASDEPGALVAAVPRSRLFPLFGLLVLMGGLVVAVVIQLRRAHELTRLRADLTAGVSHELRTPLAQILLFGETLMLERTRSERERRAAAEVIVREARRLMHLVENALHFTRADRDLLETSSEAVDLGVETRDILVSFAPLAWAAKVTLREIIEQPAPALIDAAAYRQIVLNLLENAVRYGPAGQTVTVRVERLDATTRLAVEDDGPGVPIADRERIWAPFVRLTNVRRGASGGGTGIGLAVVRDLTVRHGGRAWVERGERGGARFVVDLPARRASTRKNSRRDLPPSPTRAAL